MHHHFPYLYCWIYSFSLLSHSSTAPQYFPVTLPWFDTCLSRSSSLGYYSFYVQFLVASIFLISLHIWYGSNHPSTSWTSKVTVRSWHQMVTLPDICKCDQAQVLRQRSLMLSCKTSKYHSYAEDLCRSWLKQGKNIKILQFFTFKINLMFPKIINAIAA